MNDTKRIKLAELIEWRRINDEDPYWWPPKEVVPKGALVYDYVGFDQLPNPFTNANDCETIIEFLNSKGWQVEVHWQFTDDESLAPGAYVHIWNRFSEVHERTDIDIDRWKQAVCELALKVLT